MKRVCVCLLAACCSAMLFAAGGKGDPVNENYPDWQGLTAKNFISGREICPSDLRHKVTVVVAFEPCPALQSQLVLAARLVDLVGLYGIGESSNWETLEVPRNVIAVLTCQGKKKDAREQIQEAYKYKGEEEGISRALLTVRSMQCSMYEDVSFVGGPEVADKLPYVYVMGPDGKEPVYQGPLNEQTVGAAVKAVKAAKGKMGNAPWLPFYGSIPEPAYFPLLAKTVAGGKPLNPVAKAIVKDVVSKDAEKAREAQILFDAINQTRSDLVFRIRMEAAACPHRAAYDLQKLLKYWPGEKKRLEAVSMKIKSMPEAAKLANIFCKVMTWADPSFMCKNAGEVKKIVAELNKMKKDMEKLKESKIIVVQNGALLLDGQLDLLISDMPNRVPAK